MTGEKTEYLSRADLYRAARAPRPLPDNFAASMRWHLIVGADLIPMSNGNVRDDHKSVALRAAISLAEEWRALAKISEGLGHERAEGGRTEYLAALHAGENHKATYCANRLLRELAEYLFCDDVPEEER